MSNISASIDLFLLSNNYLAIVEQYGIAALSKYYSELALIESGVPFEKLGFSEQREAGLPRVICAAGNIVTERNLDRKEIIKPNSVAVLKLSGVMRSQDGLSHYGMDTFGEWLRAAYQNPNINGVVLEIESGGGEWMAGNKLLTILSEKNKPVISYVHFAGSAAYLAATGTDEIIMSGLASEVGSIGAFTTINKEALEKYKANYEYIYAKQSSDKNAGMRGALAGDYGRLQAEIDTIAEQFRGMVSNSRKLRGNKSEIENTLSGGMFTANDAKNRGLADSIGNFNYALKRLNQIKK
jgi:ClpP class serine protease